MMNVDERIQYYKGEGLTVADAVKYAHADLEAAERKELREAEERKELREHELKLKAIEQGRSLQANHVLLSH